MAVLDFEEKFTKCRNIGHFWAQNYYISTFFLFYSLGFSEIVPDDRH